MTGIERFKDLDSFIIAVKTVAKITDRVIVNTQLMSVYSYEYFFEGLNEKFNNAYSILNHSHEFFYATDEHEVTQECEDYIIKLYIKESKHILDAKIKSILSQ